MMSIFLVKRYTAFLLPAGLVYNSQKVTARADSHYFCQVFDRCRLMKKSKKFSEISRELFNLCNLIDNNSFYQVADQFVAFIDKDKLIGPCSKT